MAGCLYGVPIQKVATKAIFMSLKIDSLTLENAERVYPGIRDTIEEYERATLCQRRFERGPMKAA